MSAELETLVEELDQTNQVEEDGDYESYLLNPYPGENATALQLLEWHITTLDTRMAMQEGLKKRKAEIANAQAGLKVRLEATRNQILKGLQSQGMKKYPILGVGTASLVDKAESLEIEDEEAAIKYAEKHAKDLLTYTPKLNATEYKRLAKERLKDGELLPGMKIEHAHQTLMFRRAK